jgi:YfiH family protein
MKPSIFEVFVAFQATAHPLASHSLFHAFFFAGLEINGVLLDLFDDRFLLHFPLETLEGALDRFAFIDNYEGHLEFTSSRIGKARDYTLPAFKVKVKRRATPDGARRQMFSESLEVRYNGLTMEAFRTSQLLSGIPGLVHGFGTREFSEVDLGVFAVARGFHPVLLDQIHSDIVHIVAGGPAGRPPGDALITEKTGLLLVIKTADCLPILLADRKRRVVAAVHAGWRGTRSRIVERAVRIMTDRFGVPSSDLLAAGGPCIGPSCYEVGEDVRREFFESGFPAELFAPTGRPGKYLFDLPGANSLQLRIAGVPPEQIVLGDACTHCEPGLYSYRRDRNTSDRLFSFIGFSS